MLSLLPLGSPPEHVLVRIQAGLELAFGLQIRRLAPLPEPAGAFDPERGQWSSTAFLKALLALPSHQERLLGVTERDLFVPVLTFVFGEAQLRGRVAVVSLARLRPEFYDLAPDVELLAGRAVKEAVHETGHCLGLVHCRDRRCPMALSVGLEPLDYKTARPCPGCLALLQGSPAMRERPRGPEPAGGNP